MLSHDAAQCGGEQRLEALSLHFTGAETAEQWRPNLAIDELKIPTLQLLNDPKFLESLQEYDKDNIDPAIITKVPARSTPSISNTRMHNTQPEIPRSSHPSRSDDPAPNATKSYPSDQSCPYTTCSKTYL